MKERFDVRVIKIYLFIICITVSSYVIANDLLEGSVFTAIVYIDPNGIDVNTPPVNVDGGDFVNHTTPC
jgi:hypothetical protein